MTDLSYIGVTIGADVLDQLIEMAQPKTNLHKFYLNTAIQARSDAVSKAEEPQLTDTIR